MDTEHIFLPMFLWMTAIALILTVLIVSIINCKHQSLKMVRATFV